MKKKVLYGVIGWVACSLQGLASPWGPQSFWQQNPVVQFQEFVQQSVYLPSRKKDQDDKIKRAQETSRQLSTFLSHVRSINLMPRAAPRGHIPSNLKRVTSQGEKEGGISVQKNCQCDIPSEDYVEETIKTQTLARKQDPVEKLIEEIRG